MVIEEEDCSAISYVFAMPSIIQDLSKKKKIIFFGISAIKLFYILNNAV